MMAEDTKTSMTDAPRHVEARHPWGPRPVGALVPAITKTAFHKRAPTAAQVLSDWAGIVGPALAATTAPRRISGGRLTIACSGPVAMELQHLAPELLARINGWLGKPTVTELRFVQDHMPESRPASPRAPSPQAVAAVDKAVAGLPDGPLKDALSALGRSVHTANPPTRRKISTPPGQTG